MKSKKKKTWTNLITKSDAGSDDHDDAGCDDHDDDGGN